MLEGHREHLGLGGEAARVLGPGQVGPEPAVEGTDLLPGLWIEPDEPRKLEQLQSLIEGEGLDCHRREQ